MMIGFIGAGLMGKPMIKKLVENNFQVNVFNRTTEKTKDFEKTKVVVKKKINQLVSDSSIIIFMVTDYKAIMEIISSCEALWNEKTIIQMSTISPNESKDLQKIFLNQKAKYFEAPVLGSITQVINKELITLIGADETLPENILQLLETFSKSIILVGEVGKASALKLALNQLIVSELSIFSMSVHYILEKQIDINIFMDVLRNSALYATTFDKKLPNFLSNNFKNPNFPLKHMLKDLKIIIDEFEREQIFTGILNQEKTLLEKGIELGFANEDYSALFKCFANSK